MRFASAGSCCWQFLASPWRKALRLDLAFPAGVFGPVLRVAFARLASICHLDAIFAVPG